MIPSHWLIYKTKLDVIMNIAISIVVRMDNFVIVVDHLVAMKKMVSMLYMVSTKYFMFSKTKSFFLFCRPHSLTF